MITVDYAMTVAFRDRDCGIDVFQKVVVAEQRILLRRYRFCGIVPWAL
jgi:hypothetical protein